MQTRALLFDLDGTLVDSAPDIAFAANCALADLGLAPREAEEVRGFIGNGAEKLIHRCLTGTLEGIADPARFRHHAGCCSQEIVSPGSDAEPPPPVADSPGLWSPS